MSFHYAKFNKDFNHLVEHAYPNKLTVCFLFSFGKILRAVLPLAEAANQKLAESKISLAIICPQAPKGMRIEANSYESLKIVLGLAGSYALQLPGILLCAGTHITKTLCCAASAF